MEFNFDQFFENIKTQKFRKRDRDIEKDTKRECEIERDINRQKQIKRG